MLQAWARKPVCGKQHGGKRFGSAGGQLAEHEPAECPGGQESQQYLNLYKKWCVQQKQGSDCTPVLGPGEATALVPCSRLGTTV